ncbi:MAG: hypothetical protein ABIB43_01250 [archaeon]
MIKQIATGLLGLVLTLSTVKAQDNIQTTFGVQIASNYLFRGMSFSDGWVVQPYVTVSSGNFSGTLFLNNDLKTKSINEINLIAGYDSEIKGTPVGAQYLFALFPGAEDAWTQEASVSIAPTDNTNLTLTHDFGTINGQYASFSIDKVVDEVAGTVRLGVNNNYLRNGMAADINIGLIALPEGPKVDDVGYSAIFPVFNYSFGLAKDMDNIPAIGLLLERTE